MSEQQGQPPVGVTQDSVVLSKFVGLRNTIGQERLAPGELERAQNIDLDDAGQPHRRRGYTQVAAGAWHSLYTSTRGTLGVKDGVLSIINPDYSTQVLKAGVGPSPVAYVDVGPETYFSSASDSGVILADNTVEPWGAVGGAGTWLSPVVNPTSTLSPIQGRLLGAPPMATALAYYNGRVYLAEGRTVWATELFMYRYVDKTRTYMLFETDVTVIGAVTNGLYVGTRTGVYFLGGTFGEMRRQPLSAYGAIPGTLVNVPAELVHPQANTSRNAVVFMTTSGLVAGFDDGQLLNLTQDRVLFPGAVAGAALFRRQDGVNQYIGATDSGGSPTSAARIGDYVDVEIRRFRGGA